PLDARARLPWVGLMLLLPVLGALIWFWWRHRYYPARRREQPAWDPNDRSAVVVPPRRRYGAPEE
ncbi:PLDc_N domain-containing protein, partial [Micrococcus sp. HSID17227]